MCRCNGPFSINFKEEEVEFFFKNVLRQLEPRGVAQAKRGVGGSVFKPASAGGSVFIIFSRPILSVCAIFRPDRVSNFLIFQTINDIYSHVPY